MAGLLQTAPLRGDQLEAAAELMARAFAQQASPPAQGEIEKRWLTYLEAFRPAVQTHAAHGEVHACLEGPVLAGVALWHPPHSEHLMPVDRISEVYAAYRSVEKKMREVRNREITDPHWYLAAIAIDPAHAEKGIAKTLVQPIFTRAAQDSVSCYTTTAVEAAVPFYRRLGFKIQTTGVDPDSGMGFWLLRYDPLSE